MSSNGLLNDPAIIGMSSPPGPNPEHSLATKKSGLEPGSALSKLLDSAMANAAKEATPEADAGAQPKNDSQSELKSNRFSFQTFVPLGKADHPKVYSINSLLNLRSSPAVLDFDTSRLPEPLFWRTRQKDSHNANGKNNNQNSNHNNGNPLSGTGKRNRHNHQSAISGAPDSLNWDRKPAGFLKHSDIDHMSTDKISQLLGEAPEEELPDWDLPGSNSDIKIDMGNTVEDFERWKSHMRKEGRRKTGEPETFPESGETIPSNEVDSFFSFAKSKEVASENTSFSYSKPTESKSSRFSSFFSGSAPGHEEKKQSPISFDGPQSTQQSSSKGDYAATGNSRFFHSEASFPDTSKSKDSELSHEPQERLSHGPPPGIQSNYQNFNVGAPQPAAGHMAPLSNPPPGFHMYPGPPHGSSIMMGPGPRGPANNDSFFLSLLNKGEVGPAPDGAMTLPVFNSQGNGMKTGSQDRFKESNFRGPNSANAPQSKPSPYLQYQDAPMSMSPQQMGMKASPGMRQMPPGMFPPGMFPPGAQALPNSGPIHDQGQRPSAQKGSNGPSAQMRGDVPPPWMRYGPGAPGGMAPPGFNQLPHGFPPGFHSSHPQQGHQQGQQRQP